jgi:hypothetical protein
LKTQNLRTSGSGVFPNPHQRTFEFHERPKSFPGSYSTCSKQRDHPQPYTQGLFDHHSYISKPNICFLDNHDYQCDARRRFGLISDTCPTLVTTYWKRQKEIPAAAGGWGVTEYLQLDWMDDGTDGWKASRCPLNICNNILTSLNPVPNAQVCVFDGTYYKITTTNYISRTSLYTTLLGSFWGNLFWLFQPEIYFFYTF